jgi:hypothetical protein
VSLHLDYADENFRDAWIASTNDPAAIKALVLGGRALVRSGREVERLAGQVQQLQREVARLRSPDLDDAGRSPGLREVRDVMITATAECERCDGAGAVYDPDGFGWKELLAGDTATLGDRVRARIEARDLNEEPPEEGPCPDCDGCGRQSVTLTFSEYESLRRTDPAMLAGLDPPTFADLVHNPRRVVELSARELLEVARQDHRQLLVRSLRHAYREVRREYATGIRAAQAQHGAGNRAVSGLDPLYPRIENMLAEGKRIEAALALLHHELGRDVRTQAVTASLAPEL